jgi:hypothetical protein
MALMPLPSIADLDEERRRKPVSPAAAPELQPGLPQEARLRLALSVLQYNQGFVTFTDGKANTLLLVNSIFLATTAQAGLHGWVSWASLLATAGVVLLCLAVVWARSGAPASSQRGQLIYFEHILRRRNPLAYQEDLEQSGPGELIECAARQVFELAAVVDRKFRAYRWAQSATLLSAALWLANLIGPAWPT